MRENENHDFVRLALPSAEHAQVSVEALQKCQMSRLSFVRLRRVDRRFGHRHAYSLTAAMSGTGAKGWKVSRFQCTCNETAQAVVSSACFDPKEICMIHVRGFEERESGKRKGRVDVTTI